MKLSTYHKSIGDETELYSKYHDGCYDKIYISKVFAKSKITVPWSKYEIGGSGYDISINLPNEIEHLYPDYDLYKINYAIGFITRGCTNNCTFCIVRKKEGLLHFNAPIEEFWKDQKEMLLLDNNILECKEAINELIKIRDFGIKLYLSQGFNIRTITNENAKILSEIKLWKNKQWKFAWDNFGDEPKIMKGIEILDNAGIKRYQMMCYVLSGFNTSLKQDLYRIEKLDKMGIDPFVMPYDHTPNLRKLVRWCNRPQIRHKCSFLEYMKNCPNVNI